MTLARSRGFAPLALLATAGLVLAACGSDDTPATSTGDVSAAELDGVEVNVGAKNFTENILLGEILAQALEARGASVGRTFDVSTQVNRAALLSGDIDVYPDYNGTGWTEHLGNQDPSNDPDELFTLTAEQDLAENGIRWIGQTEFNNTYGFAANGDLVEANGGPFDVQGMFEYVRDNPDTLVCMEPEFPDRSDGLILFEEATGIEIPESQTEILESGLVYTQTAQGDCDFGEIFTTDGRIDGESLVLVDDPGIAIIYNLSYTWDDEFFQEHADVYEEVSLAIIEPLDQETMTDLNARVDIDGESREDVAEQFLVDNGII
ncbi:MAG: glycine betaine ABC transporter substrate-binding protein [Jiangellales bacterium]